jgi:diguanylate cyclase (GGDEF)-like protein
MGREYLKDHILYGVEQDKFMEHILELNYELSHCNTVDEMLTCIPKSIPTLQCDAMYLVTDPHLTQQEEIHVMQGVPKNMLQDPFVETGYPEKMTIAFSYENNAMTDGRKQTQHINGIFPFFDSEEKGVNFLFVPLHFKEKCVGFFAIRNAIYLMEQQLLFEIMNSLTRALEQLYTKGQMARMNQVLTVLYNRDSMTMLYNRIALEERATELLSRYHKKGSRLCVMYIDLDRLKFINDTYGHDMGDFAIKAVAFILHQKKSEEAIAFRLGGDEFLLLQPMRDENEAAVFCDSIQKELEAYGEKEKFPVPLSMSYGWVITAPDEEKDIEYYMQQADDKMYHHKCARKMQRQD